MKKQGDKLTYILYCIAMLLNVMVMILGATNMILHFNETWLVLFLYSTIVFIDSGMLAHVNRVGMDGWKQKAEPFVQPTEDAQEHEKKNDGTEEEA